MTTMLHTFAVPEVPGSKRKSRNIYTHALIGRRNVALDRQQARTAYNHIYTDDYRFRQRVIAAGLGGKAGYVTVTRALLEISTQEIGDMNLEQYVAHRIQKDIDRINKQHGLGDTGQLEVLRWSSNEQTATRAIGHFSKRWVGLQIVEVIEQ